MTTVSNRATSPQDSKEPGVATKGTSDEPFPDRKKRRAAAGIVAVRSRVAVAIRVIFLVFALVLAIGALLVAFRDNVSAGNGLVRFIKDFADAIDGPFSRGNGVFHFTGKGHDAAASAITKNALVNWGIAAVIYLIIGRVLSRFVGGRS